MRIRILVLALLCSGLGPTGTRAAPDPYRYCAQDMGGSGGTNCYFITIEQCRAAVSGAGAFCTPNPFYTGPDADTPRAAKRKR